MKPRPHIGLLTVVLLCAACAGPAAAPGATTTATARPATPALTPTPAAAAAPTNAVEAAADRGPWLIYAAGQQMWSSLDSCRSLIAPDRRVTNPYNDLSLAASPAGGWVALLTSNADPSSSHYIYADLRLELMHLPDCSRRTVTDLLNARIQQQLSDPTITAAPAAIFAVRGSLPARWSPDGSALAFVAALEGDSADLYSYDVRGSRLRRLTSGPAHVLGFWWSPDSRWLVYQLGMPSRPHYDASLAGVHVSAAGGSLQRQLYGAPVGSLGESFDGWLSDSTFIVHGVDTAQRFSLRSVDISAGQVTTLGLNYTESVAADPRSHTLAFVVRDDVPGDSLAPGLYFYNAMTIAPVYAKAALSVTWSAFANRYIVETKSDGILLLSPQLEQTFIPGETTAYGYGLTAAPDGSSLAFFGGSDPAARAGIRLYALTGRRQREVSTQSPVRRAVFSPDGGVLAYALDDAGGGYYLLRMGEPEPALVSLPDRVDGLGWARSD